MTLAVTLLPAMLVAQTLTLDDCRRLAHDNYPAIRQHRLIEQSTQLTLDNVAKGWLPQVSATAGAFGFTDLLSSDVARLGMSTENYLVSGAVTVRQNIYDGGQMDAARSVATAQSQLQQRQLDVTLYAVNERVEQLFFGILLLDEQLKQNTLLQRDLATSLSTVESLMKNGLANQSDHDAVSVEQVRAVQQQEVLTTTRASYLRMLGVFIGKELSGDATLQKPKAISVNTHAPSARPELAFYTAQNTLFDMQRKQLDARLRPTVSAMGMGALHTKVSPMVRNAFLAAGVTVSWNIGALYTRKNDLQKLALGREQTEADRETFLFNLRLQNEEADGTIRSLEKQIRQDTEIVRLRESIRSKSEKKVAAGTETVNEMVRDVNAVALARQQQAIHEIQLLREQYRQKNINSPTSENSGI